MTHALLVRDYVQCTRQTDLVFPLLGVAAYQLPARMAALQRGLMVDISAEDYDDIERRRRISAITPTEADLDLAASPPPAEWYDERW